MPALNREMETLLVPLKIGVRPVAVVLMGMLFVTSSGLGFAYMYTVALDLGMQYASAGSFIGILVLVSAFACQLGGWYVAISVGAIVEHWNVAMLGTATVLGMTICLALLFLARTPIQSHQAASVT